MQASIQQSRIIHSDESIVQVVAAAGSGKTRTIVELVRATLERKRDTRILLLSFSRKACGEIRDRLGAEQRLVEVSTFHSFAYRHLKLNHPSYARLRIISDIEKSSVLRARMLEADTAGIPLPLLLSNKAMFRACLPALSMDAFRMLASYKRERGLLEFDEWIYGLLRELRQGSVHLRDVRSRYQMVLVDEFQDTDSKQLEFLKLLRFQRLIAVGSALQSTPAPPIPFSEFHISPKTTARKLWLR